MAEAHRENYRHYNGDDRHYNEDDRHYNEDDCYYNEDDGYYNEDDRHYNENDCYYNEDDGYWYHPRHASPSGRRRASRVRYDHATPGFVMVNEALIDQEIRYSRHPFRIYDFELSHVLELETKLGPQRYVLKPQFLCLTPAYTRLPPPRNSPWRDVFRNDRPIESLRGWPVRLCPANHQAIEVDGWYYEMRKDAGGKADTYNHIAHRGDREPNRWRESIGDGNSLPRMDYGRRLIGSTKWTHEQIHVACVEKDLIDHVFGKDYYAELRGWHPDLYEQYYQNKKKDVYDFLNYNCNHFVRDILLKIIPESKILDENSCRVARSDQILNLTSEKLQRVIQCCYELHTEHRVIKAVIKRIANTARVMLGR